MLCDRSVVEIWKILAEDADLTSTIIEHMLELFQKSLPYEEKASSDDEPPVRTATQIPLAVCATTALNFLYSGMRFLL
jgi:hypothetical protein